MPKTPSRWESNRLQNWPSISELPAPSTFAPVVIFPIETVWAGFGQEVNAACSVRMAIGQAIPPFENEAMRRLSTVLAAERALVLL